MMPAKIAGLASSVGFFLRPAKGGLAKAVSNVGHVTRFLIILLVSPTLG